MPDHRIRLRGAWDRLDPLDPGVTSRVDLPTVWTDADGSGPVHLRRRFGGPRFDPTTEALELELVDVPGLRAIRLNGQALPLSPGEAGNTIRIALGDSLSQRNTLELEVAPVPADFPVPWGAIALLLVPRSG